MAAAASSQVGLLEKEGYEAQHLGSQSRHNNNNDRNGGGGSYDR